MPEFKGRRKEVLLKNENATLLAKPREQVPYGREDRKEGFLHKWRIVRIVSHLLSLGTLAVGIWIVVEVNHFYNIANSLASQSGYKGDLQISFLHEFYAVGCTLIIASITGVVFGIFSLPLDKKLSEKHRIIFPTVQWLLTCAIIIAEVTCGILLWRKGLHAKPSLELAAYTQQYTSLPTELTSDGAVLVTGNLDNISSDPGVMRTTIIFNTLQMKMKCCGSASGYEDFHDSLYFAETFPVFVPPVFCCQFENSMRRTLKDKTCYSAANRLSENISNAQKGCFAAVTEYRHRDFPIMVAMVVAVVILKVLAHLIELTTKCLRSDSAWKNAEIQCMVSIRRLDNKLVLEPLEPHIKKAEDSYVDSLMKLNGSREAITERMNNIVGCLRKRQPGQLSEEYRQLADGVFSLAEECNHSMWRISRSSPFHTVKLFDFHTSEQLSSALRKMRRTCEAVISKPVSMNDYAQKSKLCKRLLEGAFYSYYQCQKASQEAATSATFKLFAEYAEEVITASGALLNDLQSTTPDGTRIRTEALRLKSVGYKIGTYFTASNLLTLDTHSHPHEEAEAQISQFTMQVVKFVISFLEEARALSVPDGHKARSRDRRRALNKCRGEVVQEMNNLYRCIQHMVPGVMDCTDMVNDIQDLRESGWRKLNELADQERPLAGFCADFFDTSKVQKVLDSIGHAIKSDHTPEIIYKMGRRIIQLDSHRRFLQLETCGLASNTTNRVDGQKMLDILQSVVVLSSELLHNCHAYLTGPKESLTLASKAQILSIQMLTDKIKVELDSLDKLHQEILHSRGYRFCRDLDEASSPPNGKNTFAVDFAKLMEKLPKEVFEPYPQQAVTERSSTELVPNELLWRDSITELNETSTNANGTVDPSQFSKALKEIEKIVRSLRLKCALQERIHTERTLKGLLSGARIVREVNAFRDHVEELTSVANLEDVKDAAHVADFSFYAAKRFLDTCEATGSSYLPQDVHKQLLNACLSALESFSELLKFVEEKFRDVNPSSHLEKLQGLRDSIESNLKVIELSAQDASTLIPNGHTRLIND